MAFKWVTILGMVTGLTIVNWGETPMRSAGAASDESEVVPSEADEDRGERFDELLAEVAAMVPGFGGLFLGLERGAAHPSDRWTAGESRPRGH